MLVYKITNIQNGKCYIGSTNNFKRRKKEHIKSSQLKANRTYNYPLAKAFRKYGVEKFTFEVLEDNILLKYIAERELFYINKYNSLTNTGWGYNQTSYTDCALHDPLIKETVKQSLSKRCAELDDFGNILQTFDSIHDCARKLSPKIDIASTISAVCHGKMFSYHKHIIRFIDDDNNILYTKKVKTVFKICKISLLNLNDRIYFDSISEAARLENISRKELQQCLHGSSRYSIIKEATWRKCYNNNEIIDNGIKLEDLFNKHCKKAAFNLATKEIVLANTWDSLAKKINISSPTIQKYYWQNKQKANYLFCKADIFENLYDSSKNLIKKEDF